MIKDFEEDIVGEGVYCHKWEVFGEHFDVV